MTVLFAVFVGGVLTWEVKARNPDEALKKAMAKYPGRDIIIATKNDKSKLN